MKPAQELSSFSEIQPLLLEQNLHVMYVHIPHDATEEILFSRLVQKKKNNNWHEQDPEALDPSKMTNGERERKKKNAFFFF